MAYDEARQRIVLLEQPASGPGTYSRGTWEWDGTSWTRFQIWGHHLRPAPMVYDRARGHVVLFTGSANPWVYSSRVTPRTTSYGTGCAGISGPPVLSPFGPPSLGNAKFAFDLSFAAPSSPVLFVAALRPAAFTIGGSCQVLVDPWTAVLSAAHMTNASGFASLTLPVPAVSALAGLQLVAQGWVADPTSWYGGPITSSALWITIGE